MIHTHTESNTFLYDLARLVFINKINGHYSSVPDGLSVWAGRTSRRFGRWLRSAATAGDMAVGWGRRITHRWVRRPHLRCARCASGVPVIHPRTQRL